MAATPQNTPNFTAGGNVFARLASQWNQYFGAKVDAEAGTADNLTVTGTLNVTTATIVGWLSPLFKTLTVNSNTAQLPTAETGTVIQAGNQDGVTTRVEVDSFGAPSFVTVQRSDGTNAAPTTLVNGDEIGAFIAWGYNGSAYIGPQASVRLLARGTWTGSSAPTEIRFSTTPSGSLTMTDRWHIGAAGGLYADGVPGADEGVGTINAVNIYVAGVPVITGNQNITLSGDVTGSGVTAIATTLSTVNGSVGTFGGTGAIPVITVNGKGLITAISTVAPPTITVPVVKTFTANGTYTPTAGILYAVIECIGAGGGGGGCAGSSTGLSSGGGGGGGGYSKTIASAGTIGASQAVTVGSGGIGGVGNANGSAGGDTSVGTLCIGKGGSPGTGGAANNAGGGGAGGVTGTGTMTFVGYTGETGQGANVTGIVLLSGAGGQGPFGGGTRGVIVASSTINGENGPANTGAGGSGGESAGSASGANGGSGGSGFVIITEYFR